MDKRYRHRNLFKQEKSTLDKCKDFVRENRGLMVALVFMVLLLVFMMIMKTQARADLLVPYGSV